MGVPTERNQPGAVAGDEGDVCERLDVVDERRAAGDAASRTGGGGVKVGLASPPLSQWTSADLLAGDVAVGARLDPDVHLVEPGRSPIGHRPFEDLDHAAGEPLDAHDGLVGADRARRGGDQPSRTRCGAVAQQRLVLAAGGLALGAVGDDHRATAGSNRTHLDRGGEAGSATAAQTGRRDVVDEAGARGWRGAEMGEMRGQGEERPGGKDTGHERAGGRVDER